MNAARISNRFEQTKTVIASSLRIQYVADGLKAEISSLPGNEVRSFSEAPAGYYPESHYPKRPGAGV